MKAIGENNTLFGRGGLTIYPVRSCEEMLDIQRLRKAELIITDASQPLMGGVRLCRALRSDKSLKDVSLLLVCDRDEASLTACRQAGANALVYHPVDPPELFARMSELLVVPQRQAIRSFMHVSMKGKEGQQTFAGVSQNISISGLLLETEQELKKGDDITCSVSIGSQEITARGLVMRVEAIGGGAYRYGIKFQNLETKSLIIIDQFVKGRIKH